MSFSSFDSMIYCILCTITYIISYPVLILCLLPCSNYTPMLYYSFLTYCFIIYFLIRSCLVQYFAFVFSYFYIHVLFISYIVFLLYFSFFIFILVLSYISYTFVRSYSIYHILCGFVYFLYFSCVYILIFISSYIVLLVLVTVYTFIGIARLCFSYHIICFAFTFPLCILFIFFYIHACKYLRSGFGK